MIPGSSVSLLTRALGPSGAPRDLSGALLPAAVGLTGWAVLAELLVAGRRKARTGVARAERAA